jgi:hypothetical protein
MVTANREARNMSRDAGGGIALIVGALAGAAALANHPTGHDLLAGADFASEATRNALVHGTALLSVPLVFLGLLALARRLGSGDLTAAALVAFGFGAVATLPAAVASGFLATDLAADLRDGEPAGAGITHALLDYTHHLNQAFAGVDVVASSIALLLFGVAILRGGRAPGGRLPPAAGVAGLLIGSLVLAGLLAGHLRLDVHGFGLVTFAQGAWLLWMGVLLLRRAPHDATSAGDTRSAHGP